jgi:hypothetical protein
LVRKRAIALAKRKGNTMFRAVLGLLFLAVSAMPAVAQGYSEEEAGRIRAATERFVIIAPVDGRTGANLTHENLIGSSKTLPAVYLDPDFCAADIRSAGGSDVTVGVPNSGADAILATHGEVAWLAEESDVFGAKVFFLANNGGQQVTVDVGGRAVVPFYVSRSEAEETQELAQKALGGSASVTLETYPLEGLIQQIASGGMPNAYLVSPAAMFAWLDAYGRGARLIGKDWRGAGN